MHIVQVTDTLQQGGAERVAVDLSNVLFSRGHKIFFCTTRMRGPLAADLNPLIPLFCLERTSIFSGLLKFRKFVKQNKIEIVHAHGNSSAEFCILSLIGIPSVKIIHHDHNSVLIRRKRLREQIILSRADRWIVVSKPIRDWVLKKVKYERAKLIMNPINISRFQPASVILKNPVRAVALANYRSEKNYKNLLEAARLIKNKGLEVEFVCYGSHYESEYFTHIKSLRDQYGLEKIVKLNPPTMDVPQILEEADIGVLFSSHEGLPISLLEYMASSLPVVVTDVGNCGEIVRASGCGEVVNVDDPSAFVNAIRNIILSSNRSQLGENGKKYVHQHHSLDAFGTNIEEVYRTL